IEEFKNPTNELIAEWGIYCGLNELFKEDFDLDNYWQEKLEILPNLFKLALIYIWLPISAVVEVQAEHVYAWHQPVTVLACKDSLKLELEQIVKEKNALKVENMNLRQIIEENSRRDVEFKSRIEELEKSRADTAFENAELKTEVVKLRCDFKEIKSKGITTNSLEQLPISSSAKNEIVSVFTKMKNLNDTYKQIDLRCDNTPPSDITNNVSNSDETNLTNPQCTISPICAKSKSSEDKKIKFLERVHKEQIRNEIKERNHEKKLRSQDPLSSNKVIEGNSDIECPASQTIIQIKMPHNQKIEQDIIQEVILFIKKSLILSSDEKAYSQNEPNISETHDSNIEINNNGRELVQLFSDAKFAEGKMIKAKQKEVICWYTYRKAYQTSIANIRSKTDVSDKTAKNQVYAIIRASLPNVSETNLYKKTQRVGNVYKLFGKITDPITKEEIKGIRIDKVYETLYGVRSISELTDAQILNIIKQVTEKIRDILAVGQELHDEILPKANLSISVDSKKLPGITLEESLETKISIPKQNDLIRDCAYFRNKILWSYSNLYKEFSSKKFDYYKIHKGSLCLACKLSHKNEKSIKGRYEAGSYFIKCGQHEIEITV
ncbi:15876_t:CDS:2, partial [Cetraspora pellucida]